MTTDPQTFFIFILSGFITVWSFRYFSKSSKKLGEFEYFGLSAFWGVIMLMIYGTIPWVSKDQVQKLVSNQYTCGFVLSLLGYFVGYAGAWLSRTKFFRKIDHYRKKSK